MPSTLSGRTVYAPLRGVKAFLDRGRGEESVRKGMQLQGGRLGFQMRGGIVSQNHCFAKTHCLVKADLTPFPLSDPERGRTNRVQRWPSAPLWVGKGWPKAGGRFAAAARTCPSPDKRLTNYSAAVEAIGDNGWARGGKEPRTTFFAANCALC